MKKIKLLLFFFFIVVSSFGEGTKQLMPTAADIACIQIFEDATGPVFQPLRNSFTYTAPADKRLYFTVNALTEHVYFGFGNILDKPGLFTAPNWNNGNADRLHFRLRSPDGTVYTLGYNNVLIPNSGAGYISTHAQAVAGPAQLVGATGYNALYFKPDAVGEWSVEFNRGSNPAVIPSNRKTVIKYFDITVTTALGKYSLATGAYTATATANTGVAILGRLFSKAWELNMIDQYNPFKAEMYAYTTDQVVLKIDFNGMEPYGFAISCNSTGSQNTGDIAVDRRSYIPPTGNLLARPEYRIFLNDPDPAAYPTGVLPLLSAPKIEVKLCENYQIIIETTSKGFIEVLLDLDGTTNSCAGPATGYSSDGLYNNNSKDRLLGIFAPAAGTYSIPWDGKNGCGAIVPTGTTVTVIAKIQSGLTHIPLFDVEGHPKGFKVTLIRPTGPPPPNLYWDDTQVGGIAQLNGVASPEHKWPNLGNGPINGSFGDSKTINTWFYIQESVDKIITFKADNSTFDLASNNTAGICNADNIVTFEVVYSVVRFGSTTVNYTLQQAVVDPNYTFSPYPNLASYIDSTTPDYVDADGITKRKVFVSYKVSPVGSPLTLDVQLQFTAAADPTLCPAPISRQDFVACENILPITLLSFSGKDREEDVLLDWKTANELDNKGFYVQRSEDGTSFENLTFIDGKGTTNAITEYKFVDTENWTGTVYYRLLQVDNNGKTSATKTISFTRTEQINSFVLYPNPNQAGGELHIKGITEKSSIQHLQIISSVGQKILVNPTLKTTFDGIAIDLPQKMAKGIYIIQFVTEFGMQNYKFVIE